MSPAARSVFVFGVYLAVGGLALVLVPGTACLVLGLEVPAQTVWMRLCGMFFLDLAFYCIAAARNEEMSFIRRSTRTRPWTLVFLATFVACGLVGPVILVFGLVDVAATIWTALALRGVPRANARPSGFPRASTHLEEIDRCLPS